MTARVRGLAVTAAALALGGTAAVWSVVSPEPASSVARLTLVVEAALPTGRAPVRFQLTPGWRLLAVDAADARCAPYAPPGAATEPCATPGRPQRRCQTLTAHLTCVAEVPAGPVLQVDVAELPSVPVGATPRCWVRDVAVPCRWEMPA